MSTIETSGGITLAGVLPFEKRCDFLCASASSREEKGRVLEFLKKKTLSRSLCAKVRSLGRLSRVYPVSPRFGNDGVFCDTLTFVERVRAREREIEKSELPRASPTTLSLSLSLSLSKFESQSSESVTQAHHRRLRDLRTDDATARGRAVGRRFF